MADAGQLEERSRQVLHQLDWSHGLTIDGIAQQLLDRHLELPDELRAAIPPHRRFGSPNELLSSLPGDVWKEHERAEAEARGRTHLPEQHERTRDRQAP